MPRRPRVANIKVLVAHINKQLVAFSINYQPLNLRQRVEKLVEIRHDSDDLGVSVLHDSIDCQRTAKARIESYLISNVGKKVPVLPADVSRTTELGPTLEQVDSFWTLPNLTEIHVFDGSWKHLKKPGQIVPN